VQQDRIVVENFADYWNKANVPHRPHHLSADRGCDRAACEPSVRAGLDLIERLAATDIAAVKSDNRLEAQRDPDSEAYWGYHDQRRER
jgi:peptide/nickel transport system substrate-binding protein